MNIIATIQANGNEIKNFLIDKISGFTKSGFAKKDGRLVYDVDEGALEFCKGVNYLRLKTEAVKTESGVIDFGGDSVNGSLAAPLSGDITLASGVQILGMVAAVFHNDATEPQYPTGFKKLTGDYVPNQVNIILIYNVGGGSYLFTISQ